MRPSFRRSGTSSPRLAYASFRLDALADRAHTRRPVLYRRWPDKHQLVRVAIARRMYANQIEVPYTGSLQGDGLALLREVNATRATLSVMMSTNLAGYYQEAGTSPADLGDFLPCDRHRYATCCSSGLSSAARPTRSV